MTNVNGPQVDLLPYNTDPEPLSLMVMNAHAETCPDEEEEESNEELEEWKSCGAWD